MRYQRSALLASACAYALGMAAAANAQTAATDDKTQTSTSLEEVVVTGSFIATLPEDAAIPVDVISYDDLQNLGRPSNMDLVKNLTTVGQSIGELDRNNAYPIDAATINLRNLGPRFTTVVLNNRRFPEQYSPAVGRFNNINSIPNAVIGNIEVLKSGGAAIYGADAVAGVVNYITRKNVEGWEMNAEYRYIPDSDGDYNVDGLWGTKLDEGNILVSLSYQHRSILERRDRDFTDKHYLENPGNYTSYSNPGAYIFQNAAQSTTPPSVLVPAGQVPTGDRQRSFNGLVRDPACQYFGGYSGLSTTGSPICYSNYASFERLVEETDQFGLFSEYNQKFGGLDFHLEAMANYRETPNGSVTTRRGPLTFPMLGNRVATGANAGLYDRTTIAGSSAFSAYGNNPAVQYFLANQFKNSDNATNGFSSIQASNIAAGRVGLLNALWTPFGVGGDPLGEYDHQENSTTQYRLSTSLGGGFLPGFLGTDLEWEVAFTYHWTKDTRWTLDIPTHKLQNALNGFGGPNCTQNGMFLTGGTPGASFIGTPGASGCYYFNPFPSASAGNVFTGAPNPFFIGDGHPINYPGYDAGRGLQNNVEMLRWLYEPVSLARTYTNTVVDPIIRGSTGLGLPGGDIQMAFGGQFRRQDEEVNLSDNVNRSINPCPWLPDGTRVTAPGLNPVTNVYNVPTSAHTGTQGACTGMMTLSKANTVLGAAGNNYRNEKRHFPVGAVFMQFQFPILSNLNADIVGRYEKFYSDITDIDNSVFVPAFAVKWDITDWVALRATYGEVFSQVNPPEDVNPVPASTQVGTAGTYFTFNYPNLNVKPESGENFSVGFIFRAGDFNATLDYNAITIKNYSRTLTAGQIVSAMLLPGELSTNNNALIDCSNPLLTEVIPGLKNRTYVQLSAGCVQGNRSGTPGSQISNVALTGPTGTAGAGGQLVGGGINFFGGQGQVNSGQLINNALDVSFSYRMDAFGGYLMPTLSGTWVTKYELDDFVVAGVKIADGYDGVGYYNRSGGRLLQGVPEYRLAFGLLFNKDIHTINLSARYIPSVINEDATDYNSTLSRNANIGPNSSVGCPGIATMTSHLDNYPAGAGTAEFGATCAGYNMSVLSGKKIASYFNLDLLYRVQVTENLDLALNVVNVLDQDPSFARSQLAYDSGYGSPLGRTIELSAGVKF